MVRLVKMGYRPGIDESRRVRSERSLAHVEAMRDAYIKIVQARFANPAIEPHKKMSLRAIARSLTDADLRAPKGGKITYKIAQRLHEMVGDLAPAPRAPAKPVFLIKVGDRVRVMSSNRTFNKRSAIVREIIDGGEEFRIELDSTFDNRKIKFVGRDEIRHMPD